MIRQCGLRNWEFNHQIASQSAFQPFHHLRDVSFLIDLSSGVDKYLEILKSSGSKLISSIARKRRKLERDVGPIRFQYHATDEKVLDKMFEWKSQQYIKTANMDVFSYQWITRLMRAIYTTDSESFAGVLSAMYADNNLLAVHMGMRSQKVWHWWFPTYNPEYAKYSPGSLLLMEMIKHVPKRELTVIDLGKDRSRYKDQFSNRQIELAEGNVCLSTFPGKMKMLGERIARVIRKTPLVIPARIPARIIRRYRRWKKFS